MRITGLATGLDMDEIIKNSMKPYRIKIDKKGQDKEILEIKQKLYREVIKDSREFYNKYFDVASSNSLLLSKNWSSVQFTSSNENVLTVSGSGDAKAENYKITGTTGKAAKAVLKTDGIKDNKVVINGKEFTLKGDTEKEQANNLTDELKAAGINVTVRYSDFAGDAGNNAKGFIFESTVLGENGGFTIGGKREDINEEVKGVDDTYASITGFTTKNFKISYTNTISFQTEKGQVDIKISGKDIQKDDGSGVDSDKLKKVLNAELKEYNFSADITDGGEITFKSTIAGSVNDPQINVNGKNGSFNEWKDGSPTTNKVGLDKVAGNKIFINGNLIDLSSFTNIDTDNKKDELLKHINNELIKKNIDIKAELNNGELVLKSKTNSSKYEINLSIIEGSSEITEGRDAKITFEDSKGGIYTHTGTSNTVTLDGVTFKLTGEIPEDGITVSGKQDVTLIKDNLVKFFNDYNTLVEKLNTLTSEKRNRDFTPLTADQKKEMSEDEIKLWNEKVEKGQLSKDNDLTRISNRLKEAMRTLVDGTGLNLEKIGIKSVSDYSGTKNGTFTIDEDKLTKALEGNSQEVMDMFIKSPPKDETLSEGQKYSKTGLLQRVKDILYNETVTVTSSIIKKAGIEGSATAYNNEITRSIEKYEQKMSDMEKDFSRREQALYTKYANLETMMNKYNSQQSYLMQQLGLS
ncbi:MAG: flagellar filament capping protein FliD [Clostridium sp.]|uniref:flagellar filament capping protein FliD n=1 Tax=Clostridium sp. TaxID=1506 RepID=UPI00290EA1F5|nr:flagellar filament capping protein FliD [Clostridium sp.]MDU5110473.1 flagellar filament capping protein FliD [Clostridium sp.]